MVHLSCAKDWNVEMLKIMVVESKVREKMAVALAAMVLVLMSPVTGVTPVVLTTDLDRMAKLSAVPMSTRSMALAPKRLNLRRSIPSDSMVDGDVGF